ncbi:hypothetical protein F4825DRAFT_442004 [Nemania diffusa]|nr:hypothetical protein F4825DRAFT_442004 [Nemania diffusa]
MAQTVPQQQVPVASQLERSTPIPRPSDTSENTSLPQGCEASRSGEAGRAGQTDSDSAGQNSVNAVLSNNQTRFWNVTFPRIANLCGIVGLILVLIFGVTQWLGQDKGNAIAKESELVTLAFSCSDENLNRTSICQQFLDRYPNGPTISPRENSYSGEALTVRIALENTAVHLAMLDWFLQEQDRRFLSALQTGDPQLSLAQIEHIIEAEKDFLQSIISLQTTLPRQDVWETYSIPTTTSFIPLLRTVLVTALLGACAAFILKTEYGLFLLLGLYVCMIYPFLSQMQLRVGRLINGLSFLLLGLYACMIDLILNRT